jgi:hypothetical protein
LPIFIFGFLIIFCIIFSYEKITDYEEDTNQFSGWTSGWGIKEMIFKDGAVKICGLSAEIVVI